ncbi:hypothetical protein ACQP1O_25055 [Nocardia sp. CA-151230]|uniref:hypothetical protein n=1 Tax=Nocardia sp. CA-151230 TaxID=3239982 RepID=UPI003D920B0F
MLTITDRKIVHWRDYLDPLAVFDAIGWPTDTRGLPGDDLPAQRISSRSLERLLKLLPLFEAGYAPGRISGRCGRQPTMTLVESVGVMVGAAARERVRVGVEGSRAGARSRRWRGVELQDRDQESDCRFRDFVEVQCQVGLVLADGFEIVPGRPQ